jgi:hypothetical protein
MNVCRTSNENVNVNGMNHHFDTQIQTYINKDLSQGL